MRPCPLRKDHPQRCHMSERGFVLCAHCPTCQLPYDEHYDLLTPTPKCPKL
jgi:hypothetical protein